MNECEFHREKDPWRVLRERHDIFDETIVLTSYMAGNRGASITTDACPTNGANQQIMICARGEDVRLVLLILYMKHFRRGSENVSEPH